MSLTYPPFFLFLMGVQARIGKLAARKGFLISPRFFRAKRFGFAH
jgi:hypothetical protein